MKCLVFFNSGVLASTESIGVSFESDWLRKWGEFSGPIT